MVASMGPDVINLMRCTQHQYIHNDHTNIVSNGYSVKSMIKSRSLIPTSSRSIKWSCHSNSKEWFTDSTHVAFVSILPLFIIHHYHTIVIVQYSLRSLMRSKNCFSDIQKQIEDDDDIFCIAITFSNVMRMANVCVCVFV